MVSLIIEPPVFVGECVDFYAFSLTDAPSFFYSDTTQLHLSDST